MYEIGFMAFLPIVERKIEGKHSLVKRGLRAGKKSARSATTVSLMSGRHKEFLLKADADVTTFSEVAERVETLRNGKSKIAILGLSQHPAVVELENLEGVVHSVRHVHSTLLDKVASDIFYRLHHSDQQGDVGAEAQAMVEGVLADRRVRAKLQRQLLGVKDRIGLGCSYPKLHAFLIPQRSYLARSM